MTNINIPEEKPKKGTGPERKKPETWTPETQTTKPKSPNKRGRRKKKNLSDGLLTAAEKTFKYFDPDTGRMKRKVKGEFVTELVLKALTTGFFEFPATEEGEEPTRIPVSSADVMKLVQFYFTRLEGTPKKMQEEKEDVQAPLVDSKAMEELAEKRWSKASEQIAEVIAGLDVKEGNRGA